MTEFFLKTKFGSLWLTISQDIQNIDHTELRHALLRLHMQNFLTSLACLWRPVEPLLHETQEAGPRFLEVRLLSQRGSLS